MKFLRKSGDTRDSRSKVVKIFFDNKEIKFKILSPKEVKASRSSAYEYLV